MRLRVVRSGLTESDHAVSVAACRPDGRALYDSGDTDRIFYLRSTAKPFQAAVVTRFWEPPDLETLAVVCSSHDGLPVHVALIERLLSSVGLDESHLATPPAWPSEQSETLRVVRAGADRPRPIWHNCSGKHAGMLAACVRMGWDVEGYTRPDHPLQQEISNRMVELVGEETLPVGVDGCGAPVFRGTARTLANAFARLISDDAHATVRRAMSRYPVLASGPGHADASIALWLGGVAKRGAEGALAIALPGRGSIALKVHDGADRAVATAAWATLCRLGWVPPGPRRNLESALARPVFGGGDTVGSVEAL